MKSDVLVTTSELENKPSTAVKRKKNPFGVIFRATMIFIIVASISLMGLMLYLKVNYSEDVYVSGLSMYPTLNSEAKSLVGDNSYTMMFQSGDAYTFTRMIKSGDLLDYGVADPRQETLNKLKRFDIVVTYFPSDYSGGVRSENAVPKIKRIIGLPGERIELRTDDTPMGILLINGEEVKQPGNDIDRYNAPLKKAGIKVSYPASKDDSVASVWANKEITLGKDEYFVAGDNRYSYASCDSRFVGAIKTHYIHAKFGLVLGTCTVGDGGRSCDLDYGKLRWPWGNEYL